MNGNFFPGVERQANRGGRESAIEPGWAVESGMSNNKARKAFESPIYRRSRLAARLILKARGGKELKDSEKALAARLASDPAVTSRLLDQAIRALCRHN